MLQTTTKTEETLAIPELLSGEDPTLCGGDPRDRPSEEPYLMYGTLQATTKTEERRKPFLDVVVGKGPALARLRAAYRRAGCHLLSTATLQRRRPLRHGFLMSDMISSPTRHTRNDKSESIRLCQRIESRNDE
ncbi:hypothetical protein ONZ45_g14681 [Pleurotus djamor]|nr:hypothetical protein ONZ45_g14681 [Pleurotus djamor]